VKARIKDDGTVHLDDAVVFRSAKLSKAVRDAEEIVCFVGTIGFAIEKEISRLLDEHKLSEAYILDAMGSVAVEDMVEQFHQGMAAKCRDESKTVTFRFSPGYCDWPITEQKKLFSVFDAEKIGVELLDSCLMKPRKSISGVFGIAPPGSARHNPCRHCREKNCKARRV
jgi:cobalamin-dependent methionine synthase I